MCSGREGLGRGSGIVSDSCEARSRASCRCDGSSGRGKLTSSCRTDKRVKRCREMKKRGATHLETLSVPPLDLLDTRHLVQPMWKFIQLLHAVCEADGQFCREELGGAQQSPLQTSNSTGQRRRGSIEAFYEPAKGFVLHGGRG